MATTSLLAHRRGFEQPGRFACSFARARALPNTRNPHVCRWPLRNCRLLVVQSQPLCSSRGHSAGTTRKCTHDSAPSTLKMTGTDVAALLWPCTISHEQGFPSLCSRGNRSTGLRLSFSAPYRREGLTLSPPLRPKQTRARRCGGEYFRQLALEPRPDRSTAIVYLMKITFGSFGDIVVAIQLASGLRSVLCEIKNAPGEINGLISDIDKFKELVDAIAQRPRPLPPDIQLGITSAIKACRDVLERMNSNVTVKSFRTRITRQLGAASWRPYSTVAAWSILGGKKHVDVLRMRFLEQLSIIEVFLSLSHSHDHAAILDAAERQRTTVERIYNVVQDIQPRFDRGVPLFQFYDDKAKKYFRPFARTSLNRLSQLTRTRSTGFYRQFRTPPYNPRAKPLPWDEPENAPYIKTRSFWMPTSSQGRTTWVVFRIECLHYQEGASGQWIVLLGVANDQIRHPISPIGAIFNLLESTQPLGTVCSCKGRQTECLHAAPFAIPGRSNFSSLKHWFRKQL